MRSKVPYIINRRSLIRGIPTVYTLPTSSSDTDAQAFFTAVESDGSTLTTAQKSAITQLVSDLKSAGIWTKMKAIYPFVGGTSSTHKWNLKDPRDLDAAFRLTFVGSPVHSSNGIAFNGSTQYARTYLIPSLNLTSNNNHISYYSKTLLPTGVDIGVFDGTVELAYEINGTYVLYPVIGTEPYPSYTVPDSRAFIVANRVNSTNVQGFVNGIKVVDGLQQTGLASKEIYIGAQNYNAVPNRYTSRATALATIGEGLTEIEAVSHYNAIQLYQTTLNRQV